MLNRAYNPEWLKKKERILNKLRKVVHNKIRERKVKNSKEGILGSGMKKLERNFRNAELAWIKKIKNGNINSERTDVSPYFPILRLSWRKPNSNTAKLFRQE